MTLSSQPRPVHPSPAAARILADLHPVRPLARPWKRGLAVLAVAGLAAAYVTLRFGVRDDAQALGPVLLWGVSALQALYGLALVVASLRESIPARGLGRHGAAWLLTGGVGLVLLFTALTWLLHATDVPYGQTYLYWRICLRTATLVGLPGLALTLWLAFRAYPTRPAVTGALAGLGVGLLTDGSWRTFCEVSAPSHVLSAHLVSILLLTVSGLLAALVVDRARQA